MHCEMTNHRDGYRWALIDEDAKKAYHRDRVFKNRGSCICDILNVAPKKSRIFERFDPTRP